MTGPDNLADDPNEMLWKQQRVWNNDGDTAFLLNPSEAEIDSRPC
ncbi:MAG: lamin tail domain-containing protein [Acidimicrobiia bacterium]|nr:lamin tail domain-containing protein [Acidimicrobiia bacterium]